MDTSRKHDLASEIIWTLQHQGWKAFLIGGCVRDSLLGKEPKDYDIATDLPPGLIINLFEHTVPTGIQHGTVTVVKENIPFEVTTFRKDIECDGRHAEVEFVSDLKSDCERRDFTINAMAINDATGDVIDYFNGIEDLKKRVVRCVGNPDQRFQEDYLRMLRAVRFATVLNFDIEPNTMVAIKKYANNILNISWERIRIELFKTLEADWNNIISKGIPLLLETGLMQYILPEVQRIVGFSQASKWHKLDVFEHCVDVLKNVSKISADPILRFACLIHDIGKFTSKTWDVDHFHFHGHEKDGADMAIEICDRLKMDTDSKERIVYIVRWHMHLKQILENHAVHNRILSKFIRKHYQYLDDILLITQYDTESEQPKIEEMIKWIRENKENVQMNKKKEIHCILNGNKIMELLKLEPGPIIKLIKNEIIERQILKMINTEEEAIRYITETVDTGTSVLNLPEGGDLDE